MDEQELRGAASLEWRRARATEARGLERRSSLARVEIRSDAGDGILHLAGYAAVFDTPYSMGWYEETVSRGAFRASLANPALDVVLNLDHGRSGSGLPIARTTAGTLRLSEDSVGLHVDADLDPFDPDVDLLARKRRVGNLDGQMSMAFATVRDRWGPDFTTRALLELNLHRGDVSVVVQGASPTTSSDVRSLDLASAVDYEARRAAAEAFSQQLQADRMRADRMRLEILRSKAGR